MSFVVLVRHAFPGEAGEAATFGLGHRLQMVAPHIVVSSLDEDARTTATCLADALGLSWHTVDGLGEVDDDPVAALDAVVKKAYPEGTVAVVGGPKAVTTVLHRRCGAEPEETLARLQRAAPAYAVVDRAGWVLRELVTDVLGA